MAGWGGQHHEEGVTPGVSVIKEVAGLLVLQTK